MNLELTPFGDPTIGEYTAVTILVKDDHIFRADGNKILYIFTNHMLMWPDLN